MKRVIVYGIGYNFTIFSKYAVLHDVEIIAYVDRYKAGQTAEGRRILSPDEIRNLEYDEIFMLNCRNREEIKQWLCEEQGVMEDCIRDAVYINENYMLCGLQDHKYVYFSLPSEFENVPFENMKECKDVAVRAILSIGGGWEVGDICEESIFFIFRSISYRQHYTERFYDYIRAKYPNGKMTMYLNDLCCGEHAMSGVFGSSFSVEYLKRQFDLVVTYHPKEAAQYNFVWYRHPYWRKPLEPVEITTDVFFAGFAKDRLDMVHKMFLRLSESGLKCDFWIMGVEDEQQLKGCEGVTYNHLLSYTEYLEKMNKSKCILEVCQKNDISTLRFAEAVVYNKLLLVNEDSCKQSKYYNPDYIFCFDNAEDIETDWIKREQVIDYHYRENDFSSLGLLEVIEEYFKGREAREAENAYI